jgi:thioredoxin reductase/bacterioferritin-associated ferredoxin
MIRRMHDEKVDPKPDVLVVGGGLAGLSAAIAAARVGASTLLLDDRKRHIERGEQPQDALDSRVGALMRAAASAGATVRLDTSVWGCFDGPILAATDRSHTFTLKPSRLVLATGSHDFPLSFPGSSLRGVILGSRTLQESVLSGDIGGQRCAVIGLPEEAELVAKAIMGANGIIVARAASDMRLRAEGADRVEALWIGEDRVPCDMIVLVGRQAESELVRMAGCRVTYFPSAGFIPVLDACRQSTIAGIYVAGDAANPCGAEVAIAEGRLAGIAAVASIGICSASHVDSARNALSSIAPGRLGTLSTDEDVVFQVGDGTVICPCEAVKAGTIRSAIQHGASSINDVKRRTRAGMGPCRGAGCMAPIAQLLHTDGDIAYDNIEPMMARPPARSISLGQLAALGQPRTARSASPD